MYNCSISPTAPLTPFLFRLVHSINPPLSVFRSAFTTTYSPCFSFLFPPSDLPLPVSLSSFPPPHLPFPTSLSSFFLLIFLSLPFSKFSLLIFFFPAPYLHLTSCLSSFSYSI